MPPPRIIRVSVRVMAWYHTLVSIGLMCLSQVTEGRFAQLSRGRSACSLHSPHVPSALASRNFGWSWILGRCAVSLMLSFTMLFLQLVPAAMRQDQRWFARLNNFGKQHAWTTCAAYTQKCHAAADQFAAPLALLLATRHGMSTDAGRILTVLFSCSAIATGERGRAHQQLCILLQATACCKPWHVLLWSLMP